MAAHCARAVPVPLHQRQMNPLTSPLLTDLYQLTMLQVYYEQRMTDTAVFELFVRKLPPGRDFLVAAGLEVNYTVASFYGGTGLLIVISVALDLVQKINSHLVMRNYAGLTED